MTGVLGRAIPTLLYLVSKLQPCSLRFYVYISCTFLEYVCPRLSFICPTRYPFAQIQNLFLEKSVSNFQKVFPFQPHSLRGCAMITLLGPHFVLQEVTENDVAIASICWGFTLGFGFITTWTAFKQTRHVYKRHGVAIFRNPYIWMIWLEIIVCLIFSIICWMYLRGYIAPR